MKDAEERAKAVKSQVWFEAPLQWLADLLHAFLYYLPLLNLIQRFLVNLGSQVKKDDPSGVCLHKRARKHST